MLKFKFDKKFNGFKDRYFTRVLLKKIKPVDINHSEYIFIFNQVHSKFTEKLYILLSHELSKKRIPSCFLYKRPFLIPYFPQFSIDGYEISNSIVSRKNRTLKSFHKRSLFFDWTVEIENEKIEAEGIDFFPLIQNTLRSLQKRYNVSYEPEDIRSLIQFSDLLLKYFLLLKDYSQKNSKKIRLVGYEAGYVPNGILRMLCDQLSHNGDIEFIELRRGYMYYFGKHHHRASYISCCNLTRTKARSGLAVSEEELEELVHTQIEPDHLFGPISNALEKQISDTTSESQKEVIQTIELYKSMRKKVFVLFPHVFYDTPLNDKSDVFNDMCDWISETVKYFNGNDNLLLIKPHPGEFVKDQPKRTPKETLASFLSDTELSENIIILERDAFTVKDLSPFMSCGLIWRSSVAMELAFLGIPYIIAGNPPYKTLDLNYANDKDHYFHMIEQSHTLKVTDQQKTDVAKYLYLLENKHVHVSSIVYDRKVREFYWDSNALRQYLKTGDENIQAVVEQILV